MNEIHHLFLSEDEYLTILEALECYDALYLRDEVALQWENAQRYGIDEDAYHTHSV